MNEEASQYHVTVTQENALWVAVVHDLPAGATDVERMADLEPEVRDLISGLEDARPEDFEIVWHHEYGCSSSPAPERTGPDRGVPRCDHA